MATEDTEVRAPSFVAAFSMDEWRAIVQRFEAAQATYEHACCAQGEAEEQVRQASPLPAALKTERGREYLSERAILSDQFLSFDKKVEMVATVREWAPRWNLACAEYQTEECQKVCDAAHEAMDEALERMALAPAPSLDALLVKARALINRRVSQYIGEHSDNPAFASRLLTKPGDPAEAVVIHIYRDLLRLVGEVSPVLEAERFDAVAWIVEFEREPRLEVSQHGIAYYDEDGSQPPDRSMWAGLLDWQKRLVRDTAKQREENLSEAGAAGRGFYAEDCLKLVREAGGQLRVEQGELVFEERPDADRFRLVPVRRHLASNCRAKRSMIDALDGNDIRVEFAAAE